MQPKHLVKEKQPKPANEKEGDKQTKLIKNPTANVTKNGQTKWSEEMLSTHLPIYPIRYDSKQQLSMPKILFDAISPSVCCVLLGESTHGTQEFYELRSLITKYLILFKGFTSIFVEMDWPKVYRINEYIVGALDDDEQAEHDIDALMDDMKEYPRWMYRNQIIRDLICWLKQFNTSLRENKRESEMVTFYGIDMQCYDSLKVLKSLYAKHQHVLPNSAQIMSFLDAINLNYYHSVEREYAENQVRKIYELFVSGKHKINMYKYKQLVYNIDQNFMTLQAAIHYFNHECSWDIRDEHWFASMEKYFQYQSDGKYLGYQHSARVAGEAAGDACNEEEVHSKGRLILWAHNSHVCNAEVTNYSHSNIGALVKQRYGQQSVFTVCFDTFCGAVTATNHRNEPPQFFNLDNNVNESYGKLWHNLAGKWKENNLLIFLKHGIEKMQSMQVRIRPKHSVSVKEVKKRRKIRDIGVCYMHHNPYSHCSNANMLKLADVMIFVDRSNALEPLQCDKHPNWDSNHKAWQNKQNDRN